MSRNVKYQAIEGMRFYAAFLVFLVHAIGSYTTEYLMVPNEDFKMSSANLWHSTLAYLADGHHGVDIFFIISGFLMARAVLDSDNFSYRNFLWNRFRRIYPAFLASLVIMTLVWMALFKTPFKFIDFLLNLIFANAIPSLKITAYNYVSWSLGYEFAFYFIVPVLALTVRWVDRLWAAAVLLIAAFLFVPDPVIRIKGLFVGAMIGAFSDAFLRRLAQRLPLLPLLCVYILLVPMKGVGTLSYTQFYYALLVCLSGLFINIIFNENIISKFFSSPVLARLGGISYSFYLWHPLCVAVTLHFIIVRSGLWPYPVLAGLALFIVSLAMTLSVSSVSYRLFESRYFMRKGKSSYSA